MTRTLYVIGDGGFAKEVEQVADVVNATGARRGTSIEYLCEEADEIGKPMPFGRVTGTDEVLKALTSPADFAIGIGVPKGATMDCRPAEQEPLPDGPKSGPPANPGEPAVARLDRGNLITRGSAFTCDMAIGDFNVFNLNSTVGHDCRIGSFNVVNPGCNVSGGVLLADAGLLGTGSLVLEGLSNCSDVVVRGGSVVSRSIQASGVCVAVPARPLQ
jgi:hypothetical protein